MRYAGAAAALLATGAAGAHVRQSIAGPGWTVSNGTSSYPATVPGSAHQALMAAGALQGAAEYRFNEVNWSWVALSEWAFSTNFTADPTMTAAGQSTLLFLASVDGVATVELNGVPLKPEPCSNANPDKCPSDPRTKDALLTQIFELQVAGIPGGSGGVLRKGEKANNLVVRFESALVYANKQAKSYKGVVPETVNYNVWAENALGDGSSHRNFIRKTGSDFGWDWGPAFVPVGLPGDVWIETFATGHLHADLSVQQTHCHGDGCNGNVTLDVAVEVHSHGMGGHGSITVSLEDDTGAVVAQSKREHVNLYGGGVTRTFYTLDVPADKVRLWWPAGYGKPELYKLVADFVDAADGVTQTTSRTVGLRTVELVEEALPAGTAPIVTKEGTSFYFRINGVDVYAKGSNWIPADVFQTRVTTEKLEWLLQSAVDSNQNMVRVWGGGFYQPNEFYEIANKLGLMVWQEIMFACAMYPTDDAFLKMASSEIDAQVSRLASHPSIVIWGGNNENEAALGWFNETRANPEQYKEDYVRLYVDTVRPAVRGRDPSPKAVNSGSARIISGGRPFVDSSPSNGVFSVEPYEKRWGNPQSTERGDVHYYNYNDDCEDYTTYPQARFVSEHGFQSFPSFEEYEPVTASVDRSRDSELMQWRQRHANGNEQVLAMMKRHFTVPGDAPSNATKAEREAVWAYYLYQVQLQQSRCYETAFTQFRRLKSTAARTMGILYWQLNDIWQGPSWSTTEHGGSWRLSHYAVKRAFAPLLLSGIINKTSGDVEVHATSDLTAAVTGTLTVELHRWGAAAGEKAAAHWTADFGLEKLSSQRVWRKSMDDILAASDDCKAAGDCYLVARSPTRVNGQGFGDTMIWLTTPKDSKLPEASLSVTAVQSLSSTSARVSIQTSATAAHVAATVSGINGHFDDNAFLLAAGETKTLTFTSAQPFSAADLKAGLTVRSLQ